MCNCNKTRKVSAEEAAMASRARKMEPTGLPAEMLERVNPGLRVSGPVRMTVEMTDGTDRVITLRRNQEVERYLKARAMQKAPHLFFPDDPDWKYAGEDERASDLFQKVNTNV